MNSNIVFPHNRTIPYSYELPMCVVAKSRWICNVTVDFELCTFSSKKNALQVGDQPGNLMLQLGMSMPLN